MIRTTRTLAIPAMLLLAILSFINICEADNNVAAAESNQGNRLKLYISGYEEGDFLRTELHFVDFVRDRHQADVHVLISGQTTGAGGREYTITFIGQRAFDGMQDTLRYVSLESDTDDMERKGILHQLELGLVRFVSHTPVADKLTVNFGEEQEKKIVADKWNYWVFKVRFNSYFNGEQSYHNINLWGDVSANRVTEDWKFQFRLSGSYNEQLFESEDSRTLSLSRSKSGNVWIVKSLSDHWSTGASIYVYSSTYSNKRMAIQVAPAIEYNIYPYSKSTYRQLRFEYRLGGKYHDYYEGTIFDKTSEWLGYQNLSATLEVVQPWGTAETTLGGSNYLHDWGKYRLEFWEDLSLRLIEGLSLEINGGVSYIRDQLSLPKEGASSDEVLLRRREIATDYSYWGRFGISYSFGSIYNNVVNPRFGD